MDNHVPRQRGYWAIAGILVLVAFYASYRYARYYNGRQAVATEATSRISKLISNDQGLANSLLKDAFLMEKKASFETLLKEGANANSVRFQRMPIIHHASQLEDSFWLDLLLRYGADPNISKAPHHVTPLIMAVESNKPKNVELLINAGANINQLDDQGYSLLTFAWGLRHGNIVFILLTNGADPNLKTRERRSFISCLRASNHTSRNADDPSDDDFLDKSRTWLIENRYDWRTAKWSPGEGGQGIWVFENTKNNDNTR
jgi:Ankyrin repeats (3 copies)